MAELTTIRNIGPAMAAHFKRAGFTTAEEVYEAGLSTSYRRLIDYGMTKHFMAFLAIAAGLEGRSAIDHTPEEKMALRKVHDQLTNKLDRPDGIGAFLASIGLVE